MRTPMGLRKPFWCAAAALGALFVCACNHNAPPAAASVNASSPAAPVAPAQIVVSPADAAPPASQTCGFDGAKAYEQVARLVAFGPHPPATDAIRSVQKYIRAQLEGFGCAVDEDDFNAQTAMGNMAMKNIVAKIPGTGPGIILLLTHYDTKRVDNFVGAEDAGSSSGVMLEMARVLCGQPKRANAMWIAFLDGEETQAQLEWDEADSLYGSREMAARLVLSGDSKRVRAAILADMVGQKNLLLPRDSESTEWLTNLIWKTAASLGYKDIFVSRKTYNGDDHESFLKRGMPAVDIIDLENYIDLGYWHTSQDTLDKISPRSLAIIGHVILESVSQLQKR